MACIRLWLENIWYEAEEAGTTFDEEVRVTLLHEIGHLLGWDEDDVEDGVSPSMQQRIAYSASSS